MARRLAGRAGRRFRRSALHKYWAVCAVKLVQFYVTRIEDRNEWSEIAPSRRLILRMRYLKTSEAAALLNVSPNTLRAWERRFGFPKPQRSPGKHRLFTHGEVAALRDALQEGLSISSAISRAREGLVADTNSLLGALVSYERERADAAIEAALALRSVERSVEEVLLPTLDEIARRYGTESAAWAFAAHWGADWLRRAKRLAPPPVRPVSIVVGDATRDELDPDAPYLRALELLCVRAGDQGAEPVGPRRRRHRRRGRGASPEPGRRGGWPSRRRHGRALGVRDQAGGRPDAAWRCIDAGHSGRASARPRQTSCPPAPADAQRRLLELVETEQEEAAHRDLRASPHGGVNPDARTRTA